MMYVGSRGQITWEKPNALGIGGRADHDTFPAIGLVAPFYLFPPVHVFNASGKLLSSYQTIPLRYDRAFAVRTYVEEWSLVLFFLGLATTLLAPVTALLKWYEQDPSWKWLAALAVVALIVTVVSLVICLRRRGRDERDQSIRLILGSHEWGSSDPAYWHESLIADVAKPGEKVIANSFAELANEAFEGKRWRLAMWAARLCCAMEHVERGEELTSRILDAQPVQEGLARVRKRIRDCETVFGECMSLADWMRVDPMQHVTTVTTRPVIG